MLPLAKNIESLQAISGQNSLEDEEERKANTLKSKRTNKQEIRLLLEYEPLNRNRQESFSLSFSRYPPISLILTRLIALLISTYYQTKVTTQAEITVF